MALVKFSGDGQQIPIPDDVAATDASLKAVLTPFYPEMANAIIRRETDSSGQLIITMTKQAGTKGSGPSQAGPGQINPVLDYLGQQRQEINPALRVAWKLQMMQATGEFDLADLVEYQPKIEAALRQGEKDEGRLHQVNQALVATLAEPAASLALIPFGF